MAKLNCHRCGKEIERKRSRVKYSYCNDCKRFKNLGPVIDKYEAYLGVDNLGDWLYEKYIDERLSFRKIMTFLNTNANKTISSLLQYYDIPIRYGSEAIKTQWENNEERREHLRNNCSHLHTDESINKMKKTKQTEEYRKKASESKMGDKNPAYKPDLDRDSDTKRSIAGTTKWKRDIREKYNHKCDKCGSSEKLNTHHLYNWSEHPDKRFDIENGVLLCEKCHILFHHIYGQRNNTPEQYKRFKNNEDSE